MIRKLLLCVVCGAFTMASAQKTPVWRDAGVNQQNRLARHAHFFGFENAEKAKGDKKQSGRYLSMEDGSSTSLRTIRMRLRDSMP